MEKNRRNSCTGNARRISVFFAKASLNKEKFSIKYCHTSAMLADYLNKMLQGSLFFCLREVVMGWAHVNKLKNYVPPPKKERVENRVS